MDPCTLRNRTRTEWRLDQIGSSGANTLLAGSALQLLLSPVLARVARGHRRSLCLSVQREAVPSVRPKTADAIVEENEDARIDGLRTSLLLLAVIALIALFLSRRMRPSATPSSEPPEASW